MIRTWAGRCLGPWPRFFAVLGFSAVLGLIGGFLAPRPQTAVSAEEPHLAAMQP